MHLEQTYMLLQIYLENLDNYQFKFNAIDEQTSFEQIGEYIEQELSRPAQEKLASDINSLREQLEYIVYLSKLFYYYANAMSTLSSWDKFYNKNTYIQRLKKTSELAEKTQRLLSSNLQIFIKSLATKDEDAENLINNEINYLKTVYHSELSSEAEAANQSYRIIDIEKMKSQSDKDSKELQKALNKYTDRYDKEKGNQHKTPYNPTAGTTMPELKNDAFEEQAENSPTDSGHCSDDDSEISDYQDAKESLEEEEEQNQTTPQVKEDDIAEDLEAQDEPTIQTESQEQNASNKNNLLTRLWDLLIKAWQYLKNIFKLFAENDDLNNTESVRPSHSTLQQSTFEENTLPIATERKKPRPTPFHVTSVPQTLFADKNPAATSKQTNARTAEWVTSHLPKFSMFS